MMHPAPLKIVTVELPVADLGRATAWYVETFGLERTWMDGRAAMLRLPGGALPAIYLVETTDTRRLGFTNSATGVTHGVVDFCTGDLGAEHARLKARGVAVSDLRPGARGFGMTDSEGNRLGVCDVDP